jgi:hypothetical protein
MFPHSHRARAPLLNALQMPNDRHSETHFTLSQRKFRLTLLTRYILSESPIFLARGSVGRITFRRKLGGCTLLSREFFLQRQLYEEKEGRKHVKMKTGAWTHVPG